MSHEQSMEDILSSIRRVIAREDGRAELAAAVEAVADARAEPEPAPEPEPEPAAEPDGPGGAAAASPLLRKRRETRSAPVQEPVDVDGGEESDDDVLLLGPASLAVTAPDGTPAPLLSDLGAAATRHALETLNAAVHPAPPAAAPSPVPASGVLLEDVVQAALRPMLREWLDANLPAMVERMVAAEIARITTR